MQKRIRKIFLKKRISTLIISCLIISIIFSILIQVQFAQTNNLMIGSITPASGLQGANIEVIIGGFGFTEETRVFLRRATFTINPAQTYYEQNNNASLNLRIIFDVPINPNLIGSYNVTVWNPNGDEFTLIDGFTVVEEGMEFPELKVTNVSPTVIERNGDTWVEITGTGFVFIEDGSQVNDRWGIGKPFFTILKTPEGVSSYYFNSIFHPDRLEIVNSTLWRVLIHVNPDIPPQIMNFTIFNPSTNNDLDNYDVNILYLWQNDPKQIDGFTLQITENEGEVGSTSSGAGSLCIIATAAYGSEVEPEVKFLRNFRDSKVLSTYSGSNFMQAFNAFYYSWSPSVANVIREDDFLRGITRGLISPLLGTLFVSWNVFDILQFSPEFAIIIAGFVAGILLGAIYVGLPLTIASKLSKRLSNKLQNNQIIKILFLLVVSGFALTLAGLIMSTTIVSIFGSALLILSSITLSANLTVRIIAWLIKKIQKITKIGKLWEGLFTRY